MHVLIIGGTSFFGRAFVAEALARGHEVSTFNRGRMGPDDPRANAIRGDRSYDAGVEVLRGLRFDAAIDPGGIVPAHVLRTVRAVADTVPFYAYVSTLSVYRDWKGTPAPEDAPLHDGAADEDGDPADIERYERHKAGSERAVTQLYQPPASLIVRPGTVIGPWDNVGWLTWWLQRVARGGEILAPGNPHRALQLIDVRDICAFVMNRVERHQGGIFNCVPNGVNSTMGELLATCAAVVGKPADLTWIDDDFLQDHGAQPWFEVPLWLPDTPEHAYAWATPGAAAEREGLRCRPVISSIDDTWRWLVQDADDIRLMPGVPPMGLDPAKETRLLSVWRSGIRT